MIMFLKKLKKEYCYLVGILVVITILIFLNINNSLLWKDEAINASIGYNTLKYGYPIIWDGKNLVSSTDGNSFNQYLISSNYEWIPFYLVAGSFSIFGKTTFAARFPFATFAVLSVVLVWRIARKVFKNLPYVVCCTILYGFNVQFLLYSYQSRYFSLILFGIAWNILCFIRIIENEKNKGITNFRYLCAFTISIIFTFHSNRIAGITITLSIIMFLVTNLSIKCCKITIPLIIGTSTWLVWYFINTVLFNAPSFGTDSIESHIITKIVMISWKLQVYFCPLLSLFILYLIFKLIFIKGTEKIDVGLYTSLFFLVIISNVIVVALPRWGIINHYFIPVLVVAPFLVTAFLVYFYSKSRYTTVIIAFVLINTNLLNIWPYYIIAAKTFHEKNEAANLLSPNNEFTTNYGLISSPATDENFRIQALNEYIDQLEVRYYLYEYILQAMRGYNSYLDKSIEFLNENAFTGDSILVLGFEFEPIMFYTDLRVVNNMTTRLKPWPDFFTSYPNQPKFEHLTRVPDDEIDWILYKHDGSEKVMFDDPYYLQKNIKKFQKYTMSSSASVGLSNTPDLDYHKFKNVEPIEEIVIYKRLK